MEKPTYIDSVNEASREATMLRYGRRRVDGDYFAHELASLDRDDFDQIHIRMNSPGGNVFQGMSIVSAILSMNTPVCVHIDGIAASMAAVVAVAADRVCMMDFAKMMIHDPYFSGANEKTMSPKQKKALARLTDMLRQILSRRGQDETTMAKLMREETWFSAEEAQAAGLCDEITSSARNEFMNLNPLQLVAAVDAEYQTNNHEKMEKINLSAEAIVTLGSKSGQMDETAVSEAIVATVAAKDKEIADLKTAKEKAEAEIERFKKEREDTVAAEAARFADELIKTGKIAADAKGCRHRDLQGQSGERPQNLRQRTGPHQTFQSGRNSGQRCGQICCDVVGRTGPGRVARRNQNQPPRPVRKEVQGNVRFAAHQPGITQNERQIKTF